ncbi:serine/threonine-protein kinase pim-1-like [Cottoperca gobio]|uniref:non-specific serine/threonine protein kinase n=1 Tax=Cottoperca gobio TaxID=56716 RepID=A0A6J2R194_COTGO|nr:serine/threonine-protein kinase pim-1-like [Cottoperca gobio]
MEKISAQKTNTRGSPAPRRVQELNSSSSASAKDGPTRGIIRKAKNTFSKSNRISESEDSNTSEEDVTVRGVKIRDDGEGPSKKNKERRRFELNKYDEETASCSESCNTSAEVVSGRGGKRKKKKRTKPDLSVEAQRAKLEAKYKQQNQLGKGGCGSVFAGYRKADHLHVAIKHIPKNKVFCKHVDNEGKQLSVEVAVMLKLAARTRGSVGTSAPVALLDWYDLDQELVLVLERPVPAEDLLQYIKVNGGSLQEEEAKIILKQLVDATIELQDQRIFHRDIKLENILIETGSDIPRVRLIDFGLSCFVKKRSCYHIFYGTSAHTPPEWLSHCAYRAGPTTVWQLGVVLFETLHSEALFQTTKFIRKRLTISKDLSKNCQDFLQTCLSKDPQQRLTLEQLQLHPWLR